VKSASFGSNSAYTTLGLDQGDSSLTEEEVKLAYRAAVKLVHPDLGTRDPAEVARREKLTLALNEAYVAVLQDLQLPVGSRKRAPVVLDVFDRCEGEPGGY
jgi:DnaJ-class molecular chaperone